MRRCITISAVLIVACGVTPANAQAPDSQLHEFHASLSEYSVKKLQSALRDLDGSVRKGLIAIELHRRSDDPNDGADAVRLFSAALKEDATDPWAHYGLGVALFRARSTIALARSLGTADGEAIKAAQRELERALDLAPAFTEAAKVLAEIALRTRTIHAMESARSVLASDGAARDQVAELSLALNDTAAILAHEPASGLDYLRRALVLFGRDSGAAVEAYLTGVSVWDEAAARVYVEDILASTSLEEADRLRAGTVEERANALLLFWRKRSVRDGMSIAARITEHYRRLAVAQTRYASNSPDSPAAITTGMLPSHLSSLGSELDARGIVYVRYGEPHDRVAIHNALTRPNETWVYFSPDGTPRTFRFVQSSSAAGFQLISDPMEIVARDDSEYMKLRALGLEAWRQFATDNNVANAQQVNSELARYDPRLHIIAARLESLRSELKAAGLTQSDTWRATAQDMATDNTAWSEQLRGRLLETLLTDGSPPLFERPLLVFHQLATFRGAGCTDVVFSVAARAKSYRVAVDIADTVTWRAQSVDTIVFKELPENGYLRSTGVLCAKPGSGMHVRMTVSADARTGNTAGATVNVPDYSRAGLLMSDMLIVAPEEGPFMRGDARLALVPPRQFVHGAPIRLFYELYNLPLGGRYRTEITLATTEPNPFVRMMRGKKKTSITFDAEASADGIVQELRTLVPDIAPGKVDVIVRVTDLVTKQSVSNSEAIWILPSKDDVRR
ncbi:MAG: hypothetical protein ACT443_13535 [Gemmatimonadota bacterium]